MKIIIKLVLIIIIVVVSYNIGFSNGIGNQELTYGPTGFPKNCRALISANIEPLEYGEYTEEEALYSIERNCGRYGYIWSER
jgi:hypothetical protein